MNGLLKELWHSLSRRGGGGGSSLSKEEVRLLTVIRLAPQDDLSGSEIGVARGLTSKGLLRAATGKKYQLTEKGHVALRAAKSNL